MEWVYGIDYLHEDGQVQGVASAAPEAMAFGASVEEARREIGAALDAAVRGRMKFGMDLAPPPPLSPSDKREQIALHAALAAKASVYAAWKASGLSKLALAGRLGLNEREVRRILSPDHATGLDRLDEVGRALGYSLTVGARKAA